MKFNFKNLKDVIEDYDLCLFYGSTTTVAREDDNTSDDDSTTDEPDVILESETETEEEESTEYSVTTIIKTNVVKIPFTVNTDNYHKLALKVDPNDLPNINIEFVKLCKNEEDFVTFDRSVVIAINDVIRNHKMANIINIDII